MSPGIAPDNPLRRMFSGLVEQVFMSDLGICSVEVTAYISDILVDFIHVDHIHRLRTVDGASIRELSRMEADAYVGPESSEKLRAWLVHKHIGDFTLSRAGKFVRAAPKTCIFTRICETAQVDCAGRLAVSNLRDTKVTDAGILQLKKAFSPRRKFLNR